MTIRPIAKACVSRNSWVSNLRGGVSAVMSKSSDDEFSEKKQKLRATRPRSKSWITTEVERYGSCCTPRPFVEARNGRSKAQCEPSVARYRRAVRPYHRHPQWPPRDHGRYRRAAQPVFR